MVGPSGLSDSSGCFFSSHLLAEKVVIEYLPQFTLWCLHEVAWAVSFLVYMALVMWWRNRSEASSSVKTNCWCNGDVTGLGTSGRA